jgi:TetR/AcrR family transcriptional regulator, regulator of biofilm formation and stress response
MYEQVLEDPASPETTPWRVRERPRNSARRLLLLQTTLRLIAEQGIDAVTHRAVAEAAGVSLGSTTYWFASRQEMLREALAHFAHLEIATLHDHLDPILGKRLSRTQLVDRFAALLVPQLQADRWRTVAQYAFLQEAARQPELEPVCREWTGAWRAALTELFESLRVPQPMLEAQMFLAMLDGLLLSELAAPDDDFENAVLRPALRSWFERLPGGSR